MDAASARLLQTLLDPDSGVCNLAVMLVGREDAAPAVLGEEAVGRGRGQGGRGLGAVG